MVWWCVRIIRVKLSPLPEVNINKMLCNDYQDIKKIKNPDEMSGSFDLGSFTDLLGYYIHGNFMVDFLMKIKNGFMFTQLLDVTTETDLFSVNVKSFCF